MARAATSGAYLFAANLGATYPVLQQTATTRTHLSLGIVQADPILAARIGTTNTFQLADSIAAVTADVWAAHGAALVFYDIEHWPGTPSAEQRNPIRSIAQAALQAHAAGRAFGITPDGLFLGIRPLRCTFNIAAGILPAVHWSSVDALNLQAQVLADDARCGGVTTYAAFVKQAVALARNANPRIVISAQISLRHSSPTTALAAIAAVRAIVDAVYVAYPSNNCSACTPANLATILDSL
ncbi:MAG: hypothetical protein KGM44_02880 [bacterium]|nr:hypothetical protein [bacterium]